jgi:hypothetical protein
MGVPFSAQDMGLDLAPLPAMKGLAGAVETISTG